MTVGVVWIQKIAKLIMGNGHGDENEKVTVLVVDNEPKILDHIVRSLGPLDVNVLATTSLRTAHDMLEEADVLVLDWCFNDTDASDVLDRWISKKRGPVCVVNDVTTPELETELFLRGAYNVFNKPVRLDVLSIAMRRYKMDIDSVRLIKAMQVSIRRLRNMVFVLLVLTLISGAETIGRMTELLQGVL